MTKDEIRSLVIRKRREFEAAGGIIEPHGALRLQAFAAWFYGQYPEIDAHVTKRYPGEKGYKFLERFIR